MDELLPPDEDHAQVEQLRVQLAGCSVASMGNTRESWQRNSELPRDAYGWSASYSDCLAAAKREIDERERADALEAALQRLVHSWDSLPARTYGLDPDVSDWLQIKMQPAVTAARALLKPKGAA